MPFLRNLMIWSSRCIFVVETSGLPILQVVDTIHISDAIFADLNVDGLFLEYDDKRSGDFEPLKSFKRDDQTVVLGLITSKFPELEDPDTIKARIKEASQSIPLENLALSPQCGFSSTEEGNILTEEEQWNKISHMIKIAESVWGNN